MADLITEKQKKVVHREYLIRLISVSLAMASLLGIFFLAYIIPYYISVKQKGLVVAEQFKTAITAENKENVGESSARIVSRTTDELQVAEFYTANQLTPSSDFAQIIASKNSNIKITKLSFTPTNQNSKQFVVSGLSKNRNGLVDFIDNLKTQGGFANVELPISDFAKDRDIPFTLNIKANL